MPPRPRSGHHRPWLPVGAFDARTATTEADAPTRVDDDAVAVGNGSVPDTTAEGLHGAPRGRGHGMPVAVADAHAPAAVDHFPTRWQEPAGVQAASGRAVWHWRNW